MFNSIKTAGRVARSALLITLLVIAIILVITSLTIVFVTTTNVGTKYALRVLDHHAGFRLQGVSGNLIDQLRIQHLEWRYQELIEIVADDVAIQWQPKALFSNQIQLDDVRVNNLQLVIRTSGDGTPATLPASLAFPDWIKHLAADRLTVNQFQLAIREANRQEQSKPWQFSGLTGQARIDSAAYRLRVSGMTPWGDAIVAGHFESIAPFKTQAQIDWRSLAIEQHGVMVPVIQARGALSGDWKRLALQAQLSEAGVGGQADIRLSPIKSQALPQAGEGKKLRTQPTPGGQLAIVFTPFSAVPIDTLQADLTFINPAIFHPGAPKADLHVKVDFTLSGDTTLPVLRGKVDVQNTAPMVWNSGGIPITHLSSEITVQEHQLNWQASRMTFNGSGLATGSGQFDWSESAENNKADYLPKIASAFEVKNIDLLRIDSRLKATQLTGKIQLKPDATGLQLGLNLQNTQPNAVADLTAQVHLNHDQMVQLTKLELHAKQATLTAQGSLALTDQQQFNLQGEAHDFNPARWIDVPEGRIATRFKIKGQLQHGAWLDAQVAELSGHFAGSTLQGEADMLIQQNQLLAIKKLELDWGKNHLSAQGNWKLNAWQPNAANKAQQQDSLRFNLAVPDLSALGDPFRKVAPAALSQSANQSATPSLKGSLFIDGTLSGNVAQPSGQINVKAANLFIPALIAVEKLQATMTLDEGAEGKVNGHIDAVGLIIGASQFESDIDQDATGYKVRSLKGNLTGLRHAHQLQLIATLPRKYQLELQAQGDLHTVSQAKGKALQWQGQVQQLNLSGPVDLRLMSPFALQLSGEEIHVAAANWQGNLGQLQIEQFNWSGGKLKTKGQAQALSVVNLVKLWRPNAPLIGNLKIDAGWQLDGASPAAGQFDIKRTSGDISFQDVSAGHSQIFALGLKKVLIQGRIGATDSTSTSNLISAQPFHLQIQAQGDQLGTIDAEFRSSVSKTNASAPISGAAQLDIKDIQWLSHWFGSGVTLGGQLQVGAQLSGTMERPEYSVKINGKQLQLSLTELGVLLPNGIMEASVETHQGNPQLKLTQLRFSQTIKAPPKHEKLTGLTWLNETGFVESSGAIDLNSGRGSISTHWQRFPFLQAANQWLVASGDAELKESKNSWNLTGQLLADAAYFSVPKQAPPKLSSDVVVLKKNQKRETSKAEVVQSSVDFLIKTGNNFVFVGRGLNTRLVGDLRIRIQNDGPVLATGSIQTAGGTYEGYGQQLAIERGILNFQGPLDNPGLNIRAMRRGLPVEAGLEVVGTVAKPEARLISEPDVPDQDKLSWMVLGRGSDQIAGSEATLLMSAASAIFGGDSGSNIPRDLAQTFGLDEISFSTMSNSPGSQLPNQTVAGNIYNTASNEQVFSVGKRITPDLSFSIERSLTDATNGLKLTWQLTRRFSVIGRAGSDNSMDGQYLFSFD